MNSPARVAVADQPIAPPQETATDPVPSLRREIILVVALVGLVVAVALFGLVFPQLLAAAIAIALLAVIVALDWLLPSGELRSRLRRRGTR
jgi:hypothetical protein